MLGSTQEIRPRGRAPNRAQEVPPAEANTSSTAHMEAQSVPSMTGQLADYIEEGSREFRYERKKAYRQAAPQTKEAPPAQRHQEARGGG